MSEGMHHYEDWDAAYVLGALAPSERREYEAHLRTCEHCSASVAELAAMPPLLSRVPAEEALRLLDDPVPDVAPVPDVLPGLLTAVRRTRRRRRVGIAVGAAAAAAVVAGALLIPPALLPPTPAVEVALAATVPSPLSAEVELFAEPWGTRIDMTCWYSSEYRSGDDGPWEYELTVTDTSGRERFVSSWEAGLGEVVHTTGTIDVAAEDIALLEVRSARTGDVLLRGEPPRGP